MRSYDRPPASPSGAIFISRPKIGHALDNSAHSEIVAGAREPNVHLEFHISFRKLVREIRASFLSIPKIQLKLVNHNLSQRTIDAPSTWRFREATSGPDKSLFQHILDEKKGKNCGQKKASESNFACRGRVLTLKEEKEKREQSGKAGLDPAAAAPRQPDRQDGGGSDHSAGSKESAS